MKVLVNSLLLVVVANVLVACSKGDTRVDAREETEGPVPNNFVGVYRGTLSAEAKAGPITESTKDVITITVTEDNRITFQGDDPEETFTTGIGANGNFNGELPVRSGNCEGTVQVAGTVDGTTASGEIGGKGKCDSVDVGVSGNFFARKE